MDRNSGRSTRGYNPCFSGSSSATRLPLRLTTLWDKVTILVFLAALVQRKSGNYPRCGDKPVTILVFLAALVQRGCCINDIRAICIRYNPCFSGSSSATNPDVKRQKILRSYNPCFSGSSSATVRNMNEVTTVLDVTILVFLAALVQLTQITPILQR